MHFPVDNKRCSEAKLCTERTEVRKCGNKAGQGECAPFSGLKSSSCAASKIPLSRGARYKPTDLVTL